MHISRLYFRLSVGELLSLLIYVFKVNQVIEPITESREEAIT